MQNKKPQTFLKKIQPIFIAALFVLLFFGSACGGGGSSSSSGSGSGSSSSSSSSSSGGGGNGGGGSAAPIPLVMDLGTPMPHAQNVQVEALNPVDYPMPVITTDLENPNLEIYVPMVPAAAVSAAFSIRGAEPDVGYAYFFNFADNGLGHFPYRLPEEHDDLNANDNAPGLIFGIGSKSIIFPNFDNGNNLFLNGFYGLGFVRFMGESRVLQRPEISAVYKTDLADQTLYINLFIVRGMEFDGSVVQSVQDFQNSPSMGEITSFVRSSYEREDPNRPAENLEVEFTYNLVENIEYKDLDGLMEVKRMYQDNQASAPGVNVFIIESYSEEGEENLSIAGLAADIGGVFGVNGYMNAGVWVKVHRLDDEHDRVTFATTIAHEVGHYLGLYHTTQWVPGESTYADILLDTPNCTTKNNFPVESEIDTCADIGNLMFPSVLPRDASNPRPQNFSNSQLRVIKLHPTVGNYDGINF